ncbi:MAG: hypothetical protein CMQ22_05925 [Gammaproteobacteria bacterium]|nr:hypothetical protein [Gammaproteobacteria bacterium]
MAGTVMTLVVSFVLAAVLWLVIGSRFQFASERAGNDLLNIAAYFGGCLPIAFVLVFFGIGGS